MQHRPGVPPYVFDESWEGRYSSPSQVKGVPAGRAEARSVFTGLAGGGVHGPRRSGAYHSRSLEKGPSSRSVHISQKRPSCSNTVLSSAATRGSRVVSFVPREGKSDARYSETSPP